MENRAFEELQRSDRLETIAAALRDLDVPDSQVANALTLLPPSAIGLLVYGSRARGDSTPESDLDLLALVTEPLGSRSKDNVRVSCYTDEQLATAQGTLFGAHLSRDAVVLQDPNGILTERLDSMGHLDAHALLKRVHYLSGILSIEEREETRDVVGLCRVARYLLRTAIYAEAIAAGEPCFSVRELAIRLGQPELATILSADPNVYPPASRDTFNDLIARLVAVVGPLPPQRHGSIRALIVNEWYFDRDLATLATLAIADEKADFDYAELAKILL